jgi:hypothetical protein
MSKSNKNAESKQVKISPVFEREMEEILGKKMSNGTLKKIPRNRVGIPIITEKIKKAEKWEEVKKQLINTDFEEDEI